MTAEANTVKKCLQCGKALSSGDGSTRPLALYCDDCLMRQAEEIIDKRQSASTRIPSLRRGKAWNAALTIVLIAAIVVITLRAPRLIASFEDPKPLRTGSYATDAVTDQCLKNLWRGVALLQQGKRPGADLVCPAGGKPYVVANERDDAIMKCPNPALHGFREIQASRKKPMPEIRK